VLTREVREWLEKVRQGRYSYENTMYEFANLSRILTREEMKFLKSKIEETYKNSNKSLQINR
jgi:hypothetical protein